MVEPLSVSDQGSSSMPLDNDPLPLDAGVAIDSPALSTRKLGPRTIGMGRKFTVPATDLPATLYDRSINNPFSPVAMEDLLPPSTYDTLDSVSSDDALLPTDVDTSDLGLLDRSIMYEEEYTEVYYHFPSDRRLNVPWLQMARKDRSVKRGLPLRRRGFMGHPGMDPSLVGGSGSDIPLPYLKPTPKSEVIRPGLGASIALSVIVGLLAIGLTTWAWLSYRRKKRALKAASNCDDRGNADENEGYRRTGNEIENDEEKGLKSPAALDTPKGRQGFRLWSPIPLFSPSRDREIATATPPPMRRAVLCSPSHVLARSRSPSITPSISAINRRSIPGETIQSLMDALDAPLPLSLETIREGDENVCPRSRPSVEELHRRLSIMSETDSVRRHSATSTYSYRSDRSSTSSSLSMYNSSTHESHGHDRISERSNSVASDSSIDSETPMRIQTPSLDEHITLPRYPSSSGLAVSTMPSAAPIHEALDDMIGLFIRPPGDVGVYVDEPISPTDDSRNGRLDALAKAAEAIGKVAFAQLQNTKVQIYGPSTSIGESPHRPVRPCSPLVSNLVFDLEDEDEDEDEGVEEITPTVPEKHQNTPRPPLPTRRHTLPIALLSRRSSISNSPTPTLGPGTNRYSEIYNKNHLQRALSGIRNRQNSLPTVSESEPMTASSFVQAAYKFTATMGAERTKLENRRASITTKYENAMNQSDRDVKTVGHSPTPERIALARFLASVADTEEEDQDDFTPYWGSEEESDSRWLVYEENFPLPESGLPQIMVTCH